MEVDELSRIRDEVVVIDVREDHEWDAGHIPGARHIALDRVAAELDSIEAGRPVVTVCRSGPRSERAVQILRTAGRDADHLAGGVIAWARAGLPLVDAGGAPGLPDVPEEPEDPELAGFQDDLVAISLALQERFGDREPSDAEARDFMREWLAGKGTPPEEIERILED